MQLILLLLGLVTLNCMAAAATLEIVSGDQRLLYSQEQLLSRSDLETITIADSEYRQHQTRFKAISMASLFKGVAIPEAAVIQCNGTDGFSAILEKTRLFSVDADAAHAYLAVEEPGRPWPPLRGKTSSAGPFYLVWRNPRASGIGREEWPYQIAAFQVLSDPRAVFPKAYPAADAAATVTRGFRSFEKNCFACHKMNGNGAGSIGPDLNLPMNPTEYLDQTALVRLIRNPAGVRKWPGMVMAGFSAAAIPDAELDDLIAYLRYMSPHKT